MRGNNRQDIFKSETDVAEFFRVLHYSYMKQPFTLISYCIMTNHYHLLIRSPEAPLGKVMGHINRLYSVTITKRNNLTLVTYMGVVTSQKVRKILQVF
ncbi:transposase [Sporosarcina sp. YIM B06819]|uniref:transposase n=1 Tax=Sporosarcina sp. YIM B06819 TaxID=3081769 RepID=UPI003996296B